MVYGVEGELFYPYVKQTLWGIYMREIMKNFDIEFEENMSRG
jgi:hypothetical protein